MSLKYCIGIDFGTLSGRAVLIELGTGREIESCVYEYPHGVMSNNLPNGGKLPDDFALQYPLDYINVLKNTIPVVIKKSGILSDNIIGVGIDFTACTMLPVLKDGTPLCYLREYENNPYSYIKLWKHHAAQDKANLLNQKANELNEKWIERYGGKISSEWMIPKIWETLDKAPEVYEKADYFIEAADWVIWQMTGKQTRNSCTAGYKALWHKKEGYPSVDFFNNLDPRFKNLISEKLNCEISPLGAKAGEITEAMAELTGLKQGTAVAVANVDAHVTLPALGIDDIGKMLMIMGTSTCHMLLGKDEKLIEGICGYVEDGILPGLIGYEAGQSCVGDHFAWFVDNFTSAAYKEEAKVKNISIHKLLSEKAGKLKAGESGLLALDWWNGNRSVLVDADLTGMILGMTLHTKPEEIYRALIEATAYGTRIIIEAFKKNGVAVNELYAAGGIAEKDEVTMQIYADVTGLEIKISGSAQAPALGAAMFGAVAAGKEKGGYESIYDAAKEMGKLNKRVYKPIAGNVEIYNKLFREYQILHDYFGRGENNVMKTLKNIKKQGDI
ncbi:MAG: L-ribulokinase [Clostridia bacterium]|nr:L-ribulokinase [Clostridia bacterium]